MWKSFTILITIVVCSFEANAQKVVKGQILEATSHEPVIGATIIELGPKKPFGVISDLNGKFELETTASEIQISFSGFESQRFQITGDTVLTVMLLYNSYLLEAPLICYSPAPNYKLPPSLKTLGYKEINSNNLTIIAPVLNRVTGVYMHSGALNTNRITIRGIGSRSPFTTAKIKAYIDDIPLTNATGETTIEDIDLSILGSVDVLKGPTSSIYGAGLGGMLYLNTPDATIPKTEFSLDNTFGSYGLIRNVLNFQHSTDGKNLINVNLNNTFSDGYRENNYYNRTGFSAYAKFPLSDKETVSVFGNYSYLYAEIPSSLDSTNYVDNPEKADSRWANANGYEKNRKNIIGGSYRSVIGDHFSQSSSIFTSYLTTFEVRPFNILRENSFIVGARSEWAYNKFFDRSNNHFETRVGFDAFFEKHNWMTNNRLGAVTRLPLSDIQESRKYFNTFIQLKFDLKKYTSVKGGLNLNYTTYHFYDFLQRKNNYQFFPYIWSPFLSIGYDLGTVAGWNNSLSLYAKVSHGFSPPTLEETLNPDGKFNPDIVPEQGWNFEFGSRGRIFRNLNYTFSIYSMQIKDLLVAKRVDLDQYIGVNAGKTQHNGFELEVKYPFNFNQLNLNIFGSYTFADYTFKEFIDGDDDYSGNDLTGNPKHLFNAGVDLNFKSFYGNIQYNFVDKMPVNDDNSVYSDSYQLMNFKVGYQLNLGKKWSLDFYAGINNIWNEKYASMIQINAISFPGRPPRYYYPGLPRNYYFGVKAAVDLYDSKGKD